MNISDQDRNLINDGGRQYLTALLALREFRKVILNLCQDVIDRNAQRISAAMHLPLNAEAACDYLYPDGPQLLKDSWQDAWIGRYISIPNLGKAYWGLAWEFNSPGTYAQVITATVGYNFQHAAARDRALASFRQAGPEGVENTWEKEVDIREPVLEERMDQFPDALARLTNRWIELWNRLGGFENAMGMAR